MPKLTIPQGWPVGPWEFRRIDDRSQTKDGMGYVSDPEGRDILHAGDRNCTEAENVALGELAALSPQMAARIEELEAALRKIAGPDQRIPDNWEWIQQAQELARRALGDA